MKTPVDKGTFRAALRGGETKHGIFAGLASPMAAEVAAAAGADFVLLDLEHGGGSESEIGSTVVATGAYGVPTLVRVESAERIRIGRALDAGAAGLMIPRLTSALEAAAAVSHFHFPPIGDRGVASYNRAARWGMDPNALEPKVDVCTIIQIETVGALNEVENIAAIDGVDVLFVGPLDLSFALGIPRDFENPKFVQALESVVAAANKNSKTAGILAANTAAAKKFVSMGFKFIAHSSDSVLLAEAVRNIKKEMN